MDLRNFMSPAEGESPIETLRRMREEGFTGAGGMARSVQQTTAVDPSGNLPVRKSGERSKGDLLSKIQFIIFLVSLIVMPSVILPLPWGWAEFAKGLVMLFFGITLVTIELMKIFLSGKTSFIKGFLDLAIIIITGSFVLSTVFSKDISSSLWGMDGRLGTGFVVFAVMVLFFYVVRAVVNSNNRLNKTLLFSSLGISISALLSLLSFFGVNLFGMFPTLNDLFVPGFPLVASAVVGIVLWGFGLLVAIVYILRNKEDSAVVNAIMFIFSLFNITAITMFSLNQGFPLVVVTLVAILAIFAFVMMHKAEHNNAQKAYIVLLFMLLLVPTVLFRVESIRSSVVESTNAVAQISLPNQTTWQIVTSTLAESISTGLVGLGVDTFSIFYNVYKPAFLGDFDLSVTNFSFGSSEILTLMGNRGVIGALIWLIAGVFIAYQLIKDLSNKEVDDRSKVLLLGMDVALLYLFASSFFVYYGFIIYFMLLLAVTLRILLGALVDPSKAESLVMKLDLLVEQMGKSKSNAVPVTLAVVAGLIGVFFFSQIVNQATAAGKVLKAEDRVVELRDKLTKAAEDEKDLTFEAKEEELTEIINMYSDALMLQPKNSLYHRKKAMLLIDYMRLLANEIQTKSDALKKDDPNADVTKDETIANLQNQLNQVIEITLEESENATENGVNIFDNWDVRGYVYTELVGLQLTSYVDSGIGAVNNAVRLNPSSYLSYFRGSQLFVVKNDLESAGNAVSRALEINPNHIPSLFLAAELSIANKNLETATALLTRAKDILETVEATENETYDMIVKRLEEIESGEVSEEFDEVPTEDEDVVDYDLEELPDEPVDTGLGDEEEEVEQN